MDSYYKLLFEDFRFKVGLNTTCRLGRKHYEGVNDYLHMCREMGVTPYVRLCCANDPEWVNRVAILRGVDLKPYKSLSNLDIVSNHVANTETLLDSAMYSAYADFSLASEVSIISFEVG